MALLSGLELKDFEKFGLREFLEFELIHTEKYSLHVYNIISVILIVVVTWTILWGFKGYFSKKIRDRKIDKGKAFAIYQIIKYLVVVIAVVMSLESIGAGITVLLAGSTALLVGLGLGLQDFFRDIVAGFIILSERSVTVGDVVEVTNMVAQVKEVGLRTTTVYTRDDIVVIIPNSKLVREQVVNWSQNKLPTRFTIDVRVNYGTNARLVEKSLLESVQGFKEVVEIPPPNVMLIELNESCMIFRLHFFSRNLFRIERTKSELRYSIEEIFRRENIKFAFPKRDITIRNEGGNAENAPS